MEFQTRTEQKQKTGFHVVLLLLLALAALTSGMRDLDRFQEATRDLHEMALRWSSKSIFTASAAAMTTGNPPASVVPVSVIQETLKEEEFRWAGRLEPGKTIEIKGINGDIEANAAAGNEVQVVANKHSRDGDLSRVSIKVVEHPGGVTICAVYQSEDLSQSTSCGPDNNQGGKKGTSRNNNNVAVDFKVRVPAGVDFIGSTVNGAISATTLSSNVVARTVNGSINISTSGYAQAKTVNGEITARLGNANWPGSLEFKTVNGQIELDLPAATSTTIQASTFNGEISSDFSLSIAGQFSRKQMSGTIGGGGRELILKTLNGSINLRRVS